MTACRRPWSLCDGPARYVYVNYDWTNVSSAESARWHMDTVPVSRRTRVTARGKEVKIPRRLDEEWLIAAEPRHGQGVIHIWGILE